MVRCGGATPRGETSDSNDKRRAGLERAADHVALEHALPDARANGWFTEVEGLSVDHAKRAVGNRLGANLNDVTVRHAPLPGAPAGSLASTLSRVIHVAP